MHVCVITYVYKLFGKNFTERMLNMNMRFPAFRSDLKNLLIKAGIRQDEKDPIPDDNTPIKDYDQEATDNRALKHPNDPF